MAGDISRANGVLALAAIKAKFYERVRCYELQPKNCAYCGLALAYSKKRHNFCSRACSNKGIKRRFGHNICCINCGERVINPSSKYCSMKCHQEHRRNEYIKRWLNNEISGSTNEPDISAIVRNYLIKQAKFSCEECGWDKINPSTKKCPLTIDHRDGDHGNNRPGNLRVICPNCHSLTPNYGSLNRGRGRSRRKVEYARQKAAILRVAQSG